MVPEKPDFRLSPHEKLHIFFVNIQYKEFTYGLKAVVKFLDGSILQYNSSILIYLEPVACIWSEPEAWPGPGYP
jgi:hypothetical protein